ncbi:MAG: leucine-rich repeat domain-containing protein [Treponema sp.]|nr:leucine-rich repeat domain-containing protein [Treponema sp.]
MKSRIKVLGRIASGLAAVLLALASAGCSGKMSNNPESDFTAEPVAGGKGVEITGYKGDRFEVRIPPHIQGLPVTSIGNNAFAEKNIISITIPNSVTSIGDEAFSGCSSLASVNIPNGVTSIGNSAFDGCSSLASVSIPNSVTSIEDVAFSGCTSLAAITVAAANTEFSSVDGVLYNKTQSSLIQYPAGKTGSFTIPNSVTRIENGAFYGCSSLTSITIPDSVTNIGDGAFWDCSSLISVTIPNSVTSIGALAFYHCTSLTSVTIGAKVNIYLRGNLFDTAYYGLFDTAYYTADRQAGTYTKSGFTWTKQ